MLWWMKTVFAAAALIYLFTLLVGLLGNSWVIASLFRTTKKASSSSTGMNSLNPSDRLRKYIWLLALLDFFVSGSLLFRVWTLLLPQQTITDSTCRWMFSVEQSVKLCSLTCLACISIERFITIRKPFNNKFRKVAIQLTPLFAFLTVALCGSAIAWMSLHSVGATDDGLNCTAQRGDDDDAGGNSSSLGNKIAGWTLALGLCAQIGAIESNYLRIVLHVRRKFWQRKARAVASSFSEKSVRHSSSPTSGGASGVNDPMKAASAAGTARLLKRASPPPLLVVAEPRYMRDMTTAIMRVAIFHLICWLPYCLLQMLSLLLPQFLDALRVQSAFAVRVVDARQHEWTAWVAFVANWLTYFNSAGNWVLYAALNRDLRSIIKACSERRKRSTMSHHQQTTLAGQPHSPGGGSGLLKRSMRRTALHSLRFFYSLNSHRSSAASVEADYGAEAGSAATTVGHLNNSSQQQLNGGGSSVAAASPRTSLRAPSCSESIRRKSSGGQSSLSSAGGFTIENVPSRRVPGVGAELGAFSWRDGRAYCSPAAASRDPLLMGGTSNQPQRSFEPAAAHMRMAQQIIAAVYNGGKSATATSTMPSGNAPNNRGCSTAEASAPPAPGGDNSQRHHQQQRRESAQERRELFAQMHSPLPPIVISTSASVDEN